VKYARSHIPEGRSLDDVLITAQLSQRPVEPTDSSSVNRAILKLTQHLSENPPRILIRLVKTAQLLCDADSAGICLLENIDGEEVFCWRDVLGTYARYANGAMPRESPSGVVVDQDSVQLFAFPERHYDLGARVAIPINEALLVPFRVDGETIGAMWVMSHRDERKFDKGHAVLLGDLSAFGTTAYRVLASLGYLESKKMASMRKATAV
jgi:hypothetical protein